MNQEIQEYVPPAPAFTDLKKAKVASKKLIFAYLS